MLHLRRWIAGFDQLARIHLSSLQLGVGMRLQTDPWERPGVAGCPFRFWRLSFDVFP